MERERSSISIAWFLILALVVHLFLYRLPLPKSYYERLDKADRKDEIVVENWSRRKPVLQTDKAPENPRLKDKPADYAGEFDNRVEEQTRARNYGRFQPGAGGGGVTSPSKEPAKPEKDADESETAKSDKIPGGPNLSDLVQIPSTPHKLPDHIKEGNTTMLNTDAVLYASFVNRIADAIYDPWKNRAQEAALLHRQLGHPMPEKTYATTISVLLNNLGDITAIQILESSGIELLDEAPRRAFWEQKAFPNPPKQLMDEKGFIKFVYKFEFEVKKNAFSVSPGVI